MNSRLRYMLFSFDWNNDEYSSDSILKYMPEEIECFIKNIKKCAEMSNDEQIQELIDSDSINRFQSVAELYISEFDNSPPKSEQGYLVRQWITLGAITETILQIFLSVYLSDYNKSTWNLWVSFNKEIKDELFDTINKAKESETIDKNQSDALKNAIKAKIQEHTKKPSVDKLMLDNLIQFYENEEIIEKDFISQLRIIQKNRNCVHLYMKRDIDDIDQLKKSTYFIGKLMHELTFRFPLNDIDL